MDTTWTAATHQPDGRRERLALTSLAIHRAPGISPGFELTDLSPDITIVFGPNASGKSTTARAIQAVLWPNRTLLRGMHIEAAFTTGADSWTVDASAGAVRRTRNGEPAGPPLMAPVDDRMRYTLGLHELLASENQPLAQAILTESSGGFDLGAVAESRHYDRTVPPRLEAARRLDAANQRMQASAEAESGARTQVQERGHLRQQARSAREAQERASQIREALALKQAEADLDDAQAAVDAFSAAAMRMTGQEFERDDALLAELRDVHQRIEVTTRERDRFERARQDTGLAAKVFDAGTIGHVQGRLQDRAALESRRAAIANDLASATSARTTHQRRLADDIDDEQIARLDAAGIRELADIANSWEDIRARRRARDEVELWLGGVTPPDNLATLSDGVSTLDERLRTPNRHEARQMVGRSQWAAILAGLAIAIGCAWLAIQTAPLWWIGVIVGIAIILYAWTFGVPADAKTAAALEEHYSALALPQPAEWRTDAVRNLHEDLREQLRQALIEQEKADRWADLAQERDELDAAWAETESRRQQAVDTYGVAPDVSEDSLRLLAENLGRWQAADAEVRGLETRLSHVDDSIDQIDAGLHETLTPLGYDDGDAARALADLEERAQALRAATDERDAREALLDGDLAARKADLERARDALYDNLGLQSGDADGLRTLYRQHQAWQAAGEQRDARQRAVQEAAARLSLTPALRSASVDDLRGDLQSAESEAATLSAIQEALRSADVRIADAMRSQAREDALAARDDAALTLVAERDRVARAVVGDVLLSSVQAETRDAALPLVFHRARELFSIITRGKYELQFEAGPPPAFTALDTSSGQTLHLDELSSGTRVQVLMAIRLAFVESVEVGPKLPVLLDETLGNSDEFRAGAIIDAAIDICRNGRQVFYFTAQGEEVSRWQARVAALPDGERPAVKVVDLGEVRSDAGFAKLPLPAAERSHARATVPDPAEYDPETWAAALRVPGIDPWAPVTAAHIWHVIDDAATVHRLLQDDLTTWGQLASLGPGSYFDETTWQRAERTAALLDAAVNMWRIGHARPVSASALAESGVVDAAAIDEVADVVTEVNGDGAALLERLQTMDDAPVAGKPLDALELWLISEGYVSQGAPMSTADMRKRLIAMARDDVRSGVVDAATIERIVASLAG